MSCCAGLFHYKQKDKFTMNIIKKITLSGLSLAFLFSLSACTPEIGSDKWCADMKVKSKSDWTAHEATDFAKHCILK